MRMTRFAAVVACLGLLVGCKQIQDYDMKHQAKARVTTVLTGIQKGPRTAEMQTALCRWYNDSIYINESSTASFASDMFDRWTVDGGIDHGLQTFQVTDAMIEPGAAVPTVLVSGAIDGRPFQVRVPKDQTMSWLTKPKRSSRFD